MFNKKKSTVKQTTQNFNTSTTLGNELSGNAVAINLVGVADSGGGAGMPPSINVIQSDHDAIANALAYAKNAVNEVLGFASNAASDNAALTGRVLDKQSAANLEFLGEVSNFAELASRTTLEQAALSERQSSEAMQLVHKANASALAMGGEMAQVAQDASLKALDYVFESTKSETARLSEISMKWIVVAAVAVFVAPLIFRAMK